MTAGCVSLPEYDARAQPTGRWSGHDVCETMHMMQSDETKRTELRNMIQRHAAILREKRAAKVA